jgi:hypothetical protein
MLLNYRHKKIIVMLGVLSLMAPSYQNCAPPPLELLNQNLSTAGRSDSSPRASAGQKIWVSDKALAASPVMIIAERVVDPDRLCAGGCSLEYDFIIETSCGRIVGRLSYGFNESSGRYQSKIRFDENALSSICTNEEARLFEALSADDLELERGENGSLLLVGTQLEVRFFPKP